MTYKDDMAYLTELMAEVKPYEDSMAYLDALMAEPEVKPIASFLLTNGRMQEAQHLVHVLAHPKQLTRLDLSKRVRLQAERMWRLFGRDIDVEGEVGVDGYLHIHGDVRHVAALGELLIP